MGNVFFVGRRLCQIQLLTASVLMISSSAIADVGSRSKFETSPCITGEIKSADVIALKAIAPPPGPICLNSNGGDVFAAMEMGRYLRSRPSVAMIRKGDVCASACVLVLAGSQIRVVEGRVGIHRPFMSVDNATTAEGQKANYVKIERAVKSYLDEMNINPSLYDDMIRISSNRMKFLSKEDMERYGLSENDPYSEEAVSASRAKEIGISKAELLKREARIEANCEKFLKKKAKDSYVLCYNTILYGIPEEEYLNRDEQANRECRSKDGSAYRACRDRILAGIRKSP